MDQTVGSQIDLKEGFKVTIWRTTIQKDSIDDRTSTGQVPDKCQSWLEKY